MDTVAVLLLSGLTVASLDQLSKSLAMDRIPEGEFHRIIGRTGFRLVRNRRGALIALSRAQAVAAWLACVASLTILLLYLPDVPPAAATGLGAAVGGASGNLLDRLRRGAVIDFIVVGRWPTFNLADAGMVVGCVLSVWSAR